MNFNDLITKFYNENLHDFNNRDDFIAKGIDILNSISVEDANFVINEAFIPILKKHFYKNQDAFTGDIPSIMKRDNLYSVRYKENYGFGLEDNTISLNNILPIDYCFILFKFAEAGLLGDIMEYKDSELDLKDKKQELINKIESFFDGYARIMLIKNSRKQPIVADLKFRENLQSAIDQAKNLGHYTHHLMRVENGVENFVIENGKTLDIIINESGLGKIAEFVNVRSGLCFSAKIYHSSIISSLTTNKEVVDYETLNSSILNNITVWKMCNFMDYIVPNVIKIDINGNFDCLLPPENIDI